MSELPSHHDAELILKLYDLRREPVMREARRFVADFWPTSLDDVLAIARNRGSKENAYLRQITGYWEMAASFVNRGALNRDLALDNFGELFFVYAKIEPYLQGYRDAVGMQQFLQQAQQLVDSSPETRERLKNMQKLQASIRQPVAGATAGR
ncbi:MAG: hypothetical protein WAM71_04200 [Candidatus Korobacteraceae bacterium]